MDIDGGKAQRHYRSTPQQGVYLSKAASKHLHDSSNQAGSYLCASFDALHAE